MSAEDCALAIAGCADSFFYLDDSSTGNIQFPALNYQLQDTLKSSAGADSSACANTNTEGGTSQLTLTGSMSGGPIDVSASLRTSDSDAGVPEAGLASASVTLENPVTVSVTLGGQLGSCLQIPFPDLALPDNLGGLYFVVGGSLNAAVTLNVTIDAGTYTVQGGFIPDPNSTNAAPVYTFTSNCVDGNNNPTTDCISTSLGASLSGSVYVSPLWLSLGPSFLNVGAGLSAVATGTYDLTNNSIDGDICAGGNYVATASLASLQASASGDWLGPFNILGDGSLCPLGSTGTPPSTTPTITGVTPASGPTTGGTPIEIDGTNFTDDAVVLVGTGGGLATAVPATGVQVVSAGEITAVTPPNSRGVHRLFVREAAGTSPSTGADEFKYQQLAPTVTFVNPDSGPKAGGTTITVDGTGFSPTATVQIGQGKQSPVQAQVITESPTEIKAITPPGRRGSYHVRVGSYGKLSKATSADRFTYTAT